MVSQQFYYDLAISAFIFLFSTGLVIKGAYGKRKYILMGILCIFVAGIFLVTRILGRGQGKLGAVITVPASCSPCQEDGGEGGQKVGNIFGFRI